MNKQAIIDALRAFACRRPGFELGNYATMSDYRADYRKALKDRDIALRLLRDIELRDSITAEDILRECRGGRVQILPGDRLDTFAIDYCPGQYWCVEYRAAVARLCASVLWTWKRERCMPAPMMRDPVSGDTYSGFEPGHKSPTAMSAGAWLRNSFLVDYGRGIASRFFN